VIHRAARIAAHHAEVLPRARQAGLLK